MKRIRLLISLLSLCAITLPSLGQSVRSNSFDIPYVDTPSSNPLKEPAPEFKYREASGMARIIPVFAPGFPTKYQAAVSYACQLMEESLPTCYPIYVMFEEKPMGHKAIKVFINYTEIKETDGSLSHLLNNATIKRAETYTQDPIYPRPLKIGADYPDGEIILTTKDIYYSDLNPTGCPKDKYDLVTLVLHALGRILGMDITAYPASRDFSEETISPFIVKDSSPSNPNGFKTLYYAPNYASAILYSNLAPGAFYDTAITHNRWHDTYRQSMYQDGDWYRIATSRQPVLICPVKGKEREYKLHNEQGKYSPKALQYFAIDPENSETLLFQPIIKKGVAIHKVGKGLIDALLVSGWVESNPLIVGLGNDQKEANSQVDKDFMIFPKSNNQLTRIPMMELSETSFDAGYYAYSLDKKGSISRSETGLYVQRVDGKMEKIFSYERDYQFAGNLDQFCGKDPRAYFARRNMDAYAKTSDGLIKLMNVGLLDNYESAQTYIRYLYAMVAPEKPKYTIDKSTNVLHFTERFFSQEVEVVEKEYLFGQPIYTTYPVLSGECAVQLSSEDSDITIIARNKAGETRATLRRANAVTPLKVIVDGRNVTVKSEVPINSCQIHAIMPYKAFQVSQSNQYTCLSTIDGEGKYIATITDQNGCSHTAQFIVE